MKLARTVTSFFLDVKRFRAPYRIEGACPKCGTNYVRDFSEDSYLSYPVTDEVTEFSGHCRECGYEWPLAVRLTVKLTLVDISVSNDTTRKDM